MIINKFYAHNAPNKVSIKDYIDKDVYSDRGEMLRSMGIRGDREIPITIHNAVGEWVNPYFVYKMYGQEGLPPEITLDYLKDEGIEGWYEWCDFWLETFIKGDISKII